MIIIEGTFRLPVSNRDAAMPAMLAMIKASRAEVGCIEFTYAFDVVEEELMRVVERWQSREHFMAHRNMPHLLEWRSCWTALNICDPKLFIYEAEQEVF